MVGMPIPYGISHYKTIIEEGLRLCRIVGKNRKDVALVHLTGMEVTWYES